MAREYLLGRGGRGSRQQSKRPRKYLSGGGREYRKACCSKGWVARNKIFQNLLYKSALGNTLKEGEGVRQDEPPLFRDSY